MREFYRDHKVIVHLPLAILFRTISISMYVPVLPAPSLREREGERETDWMTNWMTDYYLIAASLCSWLLFNILACSELWWGRTFLCSIYLLFCEKSTPCVKYLGLILVILWIFYRFQYIQQSVHVCTYTQTCMHMCTHTDTYTHSSS